MLQGAIGGGEKQKEGSRSTETMYDEDKKRTRTCI